MIIFALTNLIKLVLFPFTQSDKSRSGLLSVMVAGLLVSIALFGCSTMTWEESALLNKAEQEKYAQLIERRRFQLEQITRWQLMARFSLVTDKEAWSGKLHWNQQSGAEFFIQFSDPAGQGIMQLTGNEESVELDAANGKHYQAKDADSLLRQETSWDLPLKSLRYWVRGLPDPGLTLKSVLDAQGLPVTFEQEGWGVTYQNFDHVDKHTFPRKITIDKGAMKLKLIVMNWIVE